MSFDINYIFTVLGAELRNPRQMYMVGGAVRDLVYGRTPKDYDIALMGKELDDTSYVFEEMELLATRLVNLGHKATIYQAYERAPTEFNDRIHGLIKATINGLDVDIMWRTEHNIIDVLNSFDFNFNQFFISATDTETVHGSKPAELEQLRFGLTPERVAHITNKWSEYNE